ncbi:cell agglutination protein Mam3 [Sorochytrium milnesiophthora]
MVARRRSRHAFITPASLAGLLLTAACLAVAASASPLHHGSDALSSQPPPHKKPADDDRDELTEAQVWLTVATIIVLVLAGGLFAGLTLGLLSLDLTALEVLEQSGQEKEKEHAVKIKPIRKKGHWLLVTLLLSNVIVNETLPILTDSIWGGGWPAVVISTTLIVIFGEIIPQSVCSRYGLAIGAKMVWPVKILMWVMSPIAYPISKILDWALGETEGMSYKRSELKALVALHVNDGEHAGTLDVDEVTIIKAVLDLRDKSVKNIMTPLEDVYMVNWDQMLDHELMSELIQRGHSRVPVYAGTDRRNIVGMLLVKKLIAYDPNERQPIKAFTRAITTVPVVDLRTPCFDILNLFQEGKSHMAVIVNESKQQQARGSQTSTQSTGTEQPAPDVNDGSTPDLSDSKQTAKRIADPYNRRIPNTIGIVTLEDVIEELIGEEIIDETDEYIDMHHKLPVNRRLQRTPKLEPYTPRLGPNVALTAAPLPSIPLPRTKSTTNPATLQARVNGANMNPVYLSANNIAAATATAAVPQSNMSRSLTDLTSKSNSNSPTLDAYDTVQRVAGRGRKRPHSSSSPMRLPVLETVHSRDPSMDDEAAAATETQPLLQTK